MKLIKTARHLGNIKSYTLEEITGPNGKKRLAGLIGSMNKVAIKGFQFWTYFSPHSQYITTTIVWCQLSSIKITLWFMVWVQIAWASRPPGLLLLVLTLMCTLYLFSINFLWLSKYIYITLCSPCFFCIITIIDITGMKYTAFREQLL